MQSPPHPLLLVMKYPLPCPSHPPLQNTLAFLPWIISHHHIRPVVLISGESSPKLLFLCQSEACYQATVWPNSLKPTPHPPKTPNQHTHTDKHTCSITVLTQCQKCNWSAPSPLLMWDLKQWRWHWIRMEGRTKCFFFPVTDIPSIYSYLF